MKLLFDHQMQNLPKKKQFAILYLCCSLKMLLHGIDNELREREKGKRKLKWKLKRAHINLSRSKCKAENANTIINCILLKDVLP